MASRVDFNLDARFDLSRVRVLLIDNNPYWLRLMASVLGSFGVRDQARCASVAEAKRKAAAAAFDVVITDCHLPDLDGYDFVRWLRRSGNEANAFIPVIIVTSHTQRSKVAKARDCGANYIVAKPLKPGVLLERLVWVSRDPRPFVEAGDYIGPDRRWRAEPPPEGVDRRGARSEQAA
jgi:DNA-binding response OmpR family regulator